MNTVKQSVHFLLVAVLFMSCTQSNREQESQNIDDWQELQRIYEEVKTP